MRRGCEGKATQSVSRWAQGLLKVKQQAGTCAYWILGSQRRFLDLPSSAIDAASATSISVGASTGAATPIARSDLLLVIQMQAADIDSTNTNSYGHGGAAAVPASGYTALNASGLYEYVRATSAVSGGAVSISGLGAGAGLINSYSTAGATATTGQRSFQVVRVPHYTTATTSSTLTAPAWNGATGAFSASTRRPPSPSTGQ